MFTVINKHLSYLYCNLFSLIFCFVIGFFTLLWFFILVVFNYYCGVSSFILVIMLS